MLDTQPQNFRLDDTLRDLYGPLCIIVFFHLPVDNDLSIASERITDYHTIFVNYTTSFQILALSPVASTA